MMELPPLKKKRPESLLSFYAVRIQDSSLQARRRALGRNRVSEHLELGLLSFQNHEKEISVV